MLDVKGLVFISYESSHQMWCCVLFYFWQLIIELQEFELWHGHIITLKSLLSLKSISSNWWIYQRTCSSSSHWWAIRWKVTWKARCRNPLQLIWGRFLVRYSLKVRYESSSRSFLKIIFESPWEVHYATVQFEVLRCILSSFQIVANFWLVFRRRLEYEFGGPLAFYSPIRHVGCTKKNILNIKQYSHSWHRTSTHILKPYSFVFFSSSRYFYQQWNCCPSVIKSYSFFLVERMGAQ